MSDLDKETYVRLLRARWRKDWRAWQQTIDLRLRNGLPMTDWMREVTEELAKGDDDDGLA